MVDWYYIFLILPLGVYPCSPDTYNPCSPDTYNVGSWEAQRGTLLTRGNKFDCLFSLFSLFGLLS